MSKRKQWTIIIIFYLILVGGAALQDYVRAYHPNKNYIPPKELEWWEKRFPSVFDDGRPYEYDGHGYVEDRR